MTDRDGRRRTQAELPIETREAMKQEDSPMWKIIDEAVRMYLGMGAESTEAGIERRISELEREREEHMNIVQSRADRISEIDDLLEDLVQQLDQLREKKASYKEQLDEILAEMAEHPDRTVLAWQSEIREAAIDEYGRDTKSNINRVVNDLRDRRDVQSADVQDHQFRKTSGPSPSATTGPAPAQADGGEEGLELNVFTEDDD